MIHFKHGKKHSGLSSPFNKFTNWVFLKCSFTYQKVCDLIFCPCVLHVRGLYLTVQTRRLFCKNAHVLHSFGCLSTWILKTHFFENESQGGKIRKRSPSIFVWTAIPHTYQNNDAITPPLDLLPSIFGEC